MVHQKGHKSGKRRIIKGSIREQAAVERQGLTSAKRKEAKTFSQGDPRFGGKTTKQKIREGHAVGEAFWAREQQKKDIALEAERAATTVNIVSKEEALKTARAAGAGRPPLEERGEGAFITKDGKPSEPGDIAAQLIPFNKAKIGIHTDNRVFNTAAEYVLNNPYAVAIAIGTTIGGASFLRAGGAGKIAQAGRAIKAGKLGRATAKGEAARRSLAETVRRINFPELFNNGFAVNTKTARLSVGIIAKVAQFMKKPSFFVPAIMGIVGTYAWGEWALGEAKENIGFNVDRVLRTEDPALIAEFLEQGQEIYDISAGENIARAMPTNLVFGFISKWKSLNTTWELSAIPRLEKELEKLQGAAPNE